MTTLFYKALVLQLQGEILYWSLLGLSDYYHWYIQELKARASKIEAAGKKPNTNTRYK